MKVPFPFQADGVARIVDLVKRKGGCLLADEMGLGKSMQAVRAAREMADRRVLVVAPASVRDQWADELREVYETVAVLGPPSKKQFKQAWVEWQNAQAVVTSYNLAEKLLEAKIRPAVLVLDEAHNIKGRWGPWAKTCRALATRSAGVISLTGTPMWTFLRDYWAVLNITFGGMFGHWRQFDIRYCAGKDGAFGWVNDGAQNLEELQARIAEVTVRRTVADVALQLPPLTRSVRWVEGNAGAKKAFAKVNAGGSAKDMQDAITATLEGKMAEVVDVCRQLGRFVCFTHRRAHAEALASQIPRAVCIHGEMDTSARGAAIKQAGAEGRGIVATIDSVGTGVNMQEVAHHGVMHSIDWVPLKLMQAEKRIHRIGQTMPVQWTYVAMRESADEVIIPNVVNKLGDWTRSMPNAGAESAALQNSLANREHEDELLAQILRGMG